MAHALVRIATACLTYLGRNALIILPMHVLAAALAAHRLAQLHPLSNPVLADAMQKLLAGLILLAAIGLFRRCPLIIQRKSIQILPTASQARPQPVAALPLSAPAEAKGL